MSSAHRHRGVSHRLVLGLLALITLATPGAVSARSPLMGLFGTASPALSDPDVYAGLHY